MVHIYCPKCEEEFEADEWESGECPICGLEYYWDEVCTEDYSDCWSAVYFIDEKGNHV